jgi:hypothetical protein
MVVSIRSAYDSSVNYILQKLEAVNITPARNTLRRVRDTVSPCLRATYHFAIFGIQSVPLAVKLAISSIPLDMAKQIGARVGVPNERDVLQQKAFGLEAIADFRAALTGRMPKSRSLTNAYQRLKHNVAHHYHSDDPMTRKVVLGGVLTTVAALGVLAIIKYVYTSGYWEGANNSYERVVYYQNRSASNISSSLLGAAITGIFGFWVGEAFDLTGKHALLQSRFDRLHTDYIRVVRTSCTATEECDQARIERDQIGTALAGETAELTQKRAGYNQLRTEHEQLTTEHNQLRTEHEQLTTEYDQFRIEHNSLRTDRRAPRTEGVRAGIELARATAERDQARIERDQAREAREQVRTDRLLANTQRDQSRAELARTIAELNETRTALNGATAELAQVKRECDAARTESNNATLMANRATAARVNAMAQRDQVIQAYYATMIQRNQAATEARHFKLFTQNLQHILGHLKALRSAHTANEATSVPELTEQQADNMEEVCKRLGLRCGIMQAAYRNPSIIDTGQTYENDWIVDHFTQNNHFPTGEAVVNRITLASNHIIRDIMEKVRDCTISEDETDARKAVHNILFRLPVVTFTDPVVLREDLGDDYPKGTTVEREVAQQLRSRATLAVPFVINFALRSYMDQLKTYREQNPDGPPPTRPILTIAERMRQAREERDAGAQLSPGDR